MTGFAHKITVVIINMAGFVIIMTEFVINMN